MTYTNIWIADKPMNIGLQNSIIDLSTEKVHDIRHPSSPLYSASFILGVNDLPKPYSEISVRMKEALKAHNRLYQWIMVAESKVVYTKFNDLP